MLRNIKQNFDKNCNSKYNFSKDDDEYKYLTNIIDYSVENKDIKTFLLFLYLHDTLLIPLLSMNDDNNEYDDNIDNYLSWRKSITYTYAYEINKFSIKDIDHYKDNIKDEIDERIKIFLNNNFNDKYDNYLIKKDSWDILLDLN
jgi:hypothetical protein